MILNIGWTVSPEPSIANGLAVPYPFAMDMIQETLESSNGLALTISEEEITAGVKEVARKKDLISPEGQLLLKRYYNCRNKTWFRIQIELCC
jgi:threonine synthase